MSDIEGKILRMYDKSKPEDEDLYDTSNVNHVAWSLVVLFAGLAIWLSIALVNAENQRYALLTGKCQDPLFKGEVDKACLVTVRARDHWWEHLWYGFTHVKPEVPEQPRRVRRPQPQPQTEGQPQQQPAPPA
ncbi:hypothetical protein [uncultured Massilia sp.]|uniref:hypothetical protein n=1 Tax=uncultured Massilia sp. TaxID=169973 RepID=UPI0025DFF6E5|nr:hypothetical protein [uncultured Massilia sp.]